MHTPRFSILGLEPDPKRAANLQRMVSEQIDADVVIATSSDDAIANLSSNVPDVVLTSALVGPEDDARLMSHLKRLEGARDVPVLTVPPVVDDPNARGRNGTLTFFKRSIPWPSFDRMVVGERIVEALHESRTQKASRPAAASAEPPKETQPAPVVERGERTLRRRAHRWPVEDIQWLTGVHTLWGLNLRLLNISTSGALVESSSKLMPDSATELQLCGTRANTVVPVRVVRSEVSDVTSLGVRYRAALAFGRRFDLVPDRPKSQASSLATPKALADLLVKVASEVGRCRHPEVLRSVYELGLQQLVSAREVRILTAPTPPADGTEAVYFRIPTEDSSLTVLQATFESDYEPAEEEFRLLKAAALVAGAVLQFETAPCVPSLVEG